VSLDCMVPNTNRSGIQAEKMRCLMIVTHYCPLVGEFGLYGTEYK